MSSQNSQPGGEKLHKLGPKLTAIGQAIASDFGGQPYDAYLYVEVGDRWISVNLYKVSPEALHFHQGDDLRLTELLWDLWRMESDDPTKRWCVLEYEITGASFDAKFKYPDQVDVESFDGDRRQAALEQRFGKKPVIYPPAPEGWMELQDQEN